MNNETKRDVFGQLLNAYQNLIMKDIEIPDGSYRANITKPWNIVYDDALPDDLPVIPKSWADTIEEYKANHYRLEKIFTDALILNYDEQDVVARAWLDGYEVAEVEE